MSLKKKDQDAIAGLYLEGFRGEREADNTKSNNAASMSVEEIVRANISSGLDQLNTPDFNGRALLGHIQNIFDTLDDENIEYDPYEIEPLIIKYIKSS